MTNNEKRKKVAATISGVIAYIRQDEDAAASCCQEAFPQSTARFEQASPFRLWGVSARRDMMNMRSMMQLKAFNR